MSCDARRSARVLPLLALAVLLGTAAGHTSAGEQWTLEGLIDPTLWKTDDGSLLLARNEGDPAADGSLRLWFAADPLAGLELVALGRLSGASDANGSETELEQGFLRYTFRTERPLLLEAGKIVTPLGNFSARYLPTTNPVIGAPTSYGVSYPLGLQLAGSWSRLDFRLALVDQPLVNESYVPGEPGSAARPAVALGLTPVTGARIGAYYTRGPYLNADVEPLLPPGAAWKDFEQVVLGLDLQYSRGHLELNADWAESSYDVPSFSDEYRGRAWFADVKYTFTPRLFAALRVEENRYLYTDVDPYAGWIAALPTVRDAELGAGWRVSPATLIKASLRADRWSVDPYVAAYFPDGYAAALQFVQRFDVRSWFEAPSAR